MPPEGGADRQRNANNLRERCLLERFLACQGRSFLRAEARGAGANRGRTMYKRARHSPQWESDQNARRTYQPQTGDPRGLTGADSRHSSLTNLNLVQQTCSTKGSCNSNPKHSGHREPAKALAPDTSLRKSLARSPAASSRYCYELSKRVSVENPASEQTRSQSERKHPDGAGLWGGYHYRQYAETHIRGAYAAAPSGISLQECCTASVRISVRDRVSPPVGI